MASTAFASLFTTFAVQKLGEHFDQISRCARLLSPEQLWHRTNAHCNSVANLLLHLDGNVQQWIVGGLGGAPVTRDRPAEFAARGGPDADALLVPLDATVRQAQRLIVTAPPATLEQATKIQGYQVTGVQNVFHVVEHFALHTGQIVHMAKALLDVDLSLYDAQGRPHADRQGP